MSIDPVQLAFLEQTRATLHFGEGKPIGIDFYPAPASSLRLQTHGWTLLEVVASAVKLQEKHLQRARRTVTR